MPFQYKRVLVVGATAGIGAALADRFISEGSKVIAVGRRQERLDAFVKKHGSDRASAICFDVTDTAGLPGFINEVTGTYPDLDSVFLNAGVQSTVRLSRPDEVDLAAFHAEMNTNFTSMVNLAISFTSILLKKPGPTSLIVTTSHLSLVPGVATPAYSSSKAALKAFFDCLRRQNQGKQCKFIDISPPAVQTELHDYMGKERGRAMGMPLDDFVQDAYMQLEEGREHIYVSQPMPDVGEAFESLVATRQKVFDTMSDRLLSVFPL